MGFDVADQALIDFLSEGQVTSLKAVKETEASEEQ